MSEPSDDAHLREQIRAGSMATSPDAKTAARAEGASRILEERYTRSALRLTKVALVLNAIAVLILAVSITIQVWPRRAQTAGSFDFDIVDGEFSNVVYSLDPVTGDAVATVWNYAMVVRYRFPRYGEPQVDRFPLAQGEGLPPLPTPGSE